MQNFKILDCTLRDGGYYTNWDFSRELVKEYIDAFNVLPVDYLELGYRSRPLDGYLGEYFYCPVYILEEIRSWTDKKLVIILNEKDVRKEDAEELIRPIVGLIDMVRIAVDPDNFERAIELAREIKKIGLRVSFNVMYMSTWKERKEFLDQIPLCNDLMEYFYMVDSYGGVYPKDVEEIFELVRSRTNVKIGFHGHNNLELAHVNTLVAIDAGVDIVDATVTGMGRGAGNLKTELLLTGLNTSMDLEVNFNALSHIVDRFEELQAQYKWGTNLPYMVSGANSLPQKNVMEWVTMGSYSFNSIIRALQNKKHGKKDNQKFEDFKPEKQYSKALIVGGGPSAVEHLQAILGFVDQAEDLCIIHASSKNAKHYKHIDREQFFCLVGSEGHRLESVFKELDGFKSDCILPPFPRKMGTYVPEDVIDSTYEMSSVNIVPDINDTHTVLAFQLARDLGVQEAFLVGYDGYNKDTISTKEQKLFNENEYIFAHAMKLMSLISIVPSAYSIPSKSVYSFVS